MSTVRTLLPALLLFAVACDADGDGLSNSKEKKLGTDPKVADSDGDGLSDGEEADLGLDAQVADTDGDGLNDGDEIALDTDPNQADSDGDGYSDFSEWQEESDPNDPDSVVYQGGWPHNPFKHELADPGLQGGHATGDLLPRRTGKDQFGDTVDLYDFAGNGTPIMVDIAAEWCGPCRDMADWLDGGSNGQYDSYKNVRRAINRGEVVWITLIGQDFSGGQADADTVATWAEEFPNENIPVIVDRQQRLTDWAGLQYFPSTMWLNEDLEIESWSPSNPSRSLADLSAYCDEHGLGQRNQ